MRRAVTEYRYYFIVVSSLPPVNLLELFKERECRDHDQDQIVDTTHDAGRRIGASTNSAKHQSDDEDAEQRVEPVLEGM